MSSSPYSSRGLRRSPIAERRLSRGRSRRSGWGRGRIDDRGSSVRNALINRDAPQRPSITRDDINYIRERNAANERQIRRDATEQRGIATRNRARTIEAKIKTEQFRNSRSNM